MKQSQEKTFLTTIRQQLDDDVARMDELTVARLTAARKQAIAASPRIRRMRLITGLATAACVLLVVALLQKPIGLQHQFDKLGAIATIEDVELIEDLDFYDWLETAQVAEEQSNAVMHEVLSKRV